MANDNINDILNKRARDNQLRSDIQSRMSERDKSYYTLNERFEGRKKLGDMAQGKGLSKDSKEIEGMLKDIMGQAQKGTLNELKISLARLKQVSKVVKEDQMDPEEYERLYGHIADMQKVIAKDVEQKNSRFSKVKGIVKEHGVDIGALLVGMTGGDPLAALAVKFVGDKIKARRERKVNEKNQLNSQLNADAEALRPSDDIQGPEANQKKKDSTFIFGPGVDQDEFQGKASGLNQTNLILAEMEKDLKTLVRIATQGEDARERSGLNDAENSLESGLGKGPVGAKVGGADSKQSGAAQGKGFINSILSGIGLGGGGNLLKFIGKWGLIGGIIGTALYGVYDVLQSYFKTGKFGNSETEKLIDEVNTKVLELMGNLGDGAKWGSEAGSDIPIVGPIIGGLFGMLVEGMSNIWDSGTIQKLFSDMWDDVTASFEGIIDSITDTLTDLYEQIGQSITDMAIEVLNSLPVGIPGVQGMLDSLNETRNKRILDAAKKKGAQKKARAAKQAARKESAAAPSVAPPTAATSSASVPPSGAATGGSSSAPTSQRESSTPSVTKNEGMNYVNQAMDQAGITDPTERAALMAQVAHESGGFKYLRELGGPAYFDKYEPGTSKGKNLGNTEPGDGARYKGRGFIQLTGRANYRTYSKLVGVDLEGHPELAERPDIAAKIAIAYWQTRVKPNVKNFNDVTAVTKLVNGGTNGLADRQQYFAAYKANPTLLASASPSTAAASPNQYASNLNSAQTAVSSAEADLRGQVNVIPINMGGQSTAPRQQYASNNTEAKTGMPMTTSAQGSVTQAMMDL